MNTKNEGKCGVLNFGGDLRDGEINLLHETSPGPAASNAVVPWIEAEAADLH